MLLWYLHVIKNDLWTIFTDQGLLYLDYGICKALKLVVLLKGRINIVSTNSSVKCLIQEYK